MLRVIFEVDLSSNAEVSLSKLRGSKSQSPTKQSKQSIKEPTALEENFASDNENSADELMHSQGSSPKFSKQSKGGRKFDLISSLEQKYGGGAHYGLSDEESSRGADSTTQSKKKTKKGADDEWYDTDDSWIDDSELVMQQEERDECAATQTEHGGFFVNAGDLQVTTKYSPKKMKKRKKMDPKPAETLKQKKVKDEWVPDTETQRILDQLKIDTTAFLSNHKSKRFALGLDSIIQPADSSVKKRLPHIWGMDAYLSAMGSIMNGLSKKRARQHLNRMEKHCMYDDALQGQTHALQKLSALVHEQCVQVKWEDKWLLWKQKNEDLLAQDSDTKPKKPPVFPYTPAIALALVEAATKHEDTLKALNSLRKANKVCGLTLLDDGVEIDEVKFDKAKQLEALCSCWPNEQVSRFSVSTKVGQERKRVLSDNVITPASSSNSCSNPPQQVMEPLVVSSSELESKGDTLDGLTKDVHEAGSEVIPKVKKANTQEKAGAVAKTSKQGTSKNVYMLPLKGVTFPRMQLLPGKNEVVAEVGQRLYIPPFDFPETPTSASKPK